MTFMDFLDYFKTGKCLWPFINHRSDSLFVVTVDDTHSRFFIAENLKHHVTNMTYLPSEGGGFFMAQV